jgi:hypothetical protein
MISELLEWIDKSLSDVAWKRQTDRNMYLIGIGVDDTLTIVRQKILELTTPGQAVSLEDRETFFTEE